jgi:hypothetical protein
MSATGIADMAGEGSVSFIWAVFPSRWRKGLMPISIAGLLVLTTCGGSPDKSPRRFPTNPAFTGKITVVVSEPRTESFVTFTYECDLDAGTVTLKGMHESSNNAGIPLGPFATGHVGCYRSPKLESPDGKFAARCEGPMPGVPRDHQADSIVVEGKQGKEVFRQEVDYTLRVIGYAWSPDSRSIAAAESSERWGLNPLDLLGALSGHPTPIYAFYVRPYRIDGSAALGALPPVRQGSRNGFGIIVGWK